MDWKKYFKMLRDWKQLPAYRLEPCISAFIGYYLEEIISDHMQAKIIGVIPEFPIRRKILDSSISDERSIKVDYLLISKEKPNYLVEIKTDSNSFNKKQYKRFLQAKQIGLGVLINGIKPINNATKKTKNKYNYLINKLSLLDEKHKFIGNNEELEIIYIQPSRIFMAPSEDEKPIIIDFTQVAEWLRKKGNASGSFEKYLEEAIEKWAKD